MFQDVDSHQIRDWQLEYLTESGVNTAPTNSELWQYIFQNHKYNCMLWDEEDKARRKDVSDAEIATNKRNIDVYNQQRNDYVEKIDDIILKRIPNDHKFSKDAWCNSETAGSIIDRLSINSLKCFHMKKQVMRENASQEHIAQCTKKLSALESQGAGLVESLERLLRGIENGTAFYRIYRQFKMYNDPNLNPYLLGK